MTQSVGLGNCLQQLYRYKMEKELHNLSYPPHTLRQSSQGDEMGGTCNTHGSEGKYIQYFGQKREGKRKHLDHFRGDRQTIIK